MIDYEYYSTPAAFTRFLFRSLNIAGGIFEPCVGDGAIVRGCREQWSHGIADVAGRRWLTNDLDPQWPADDHDNARFALSWDRWGQHGDIDWVVTNPPFTPALEIVSQALRVANVGVAMHLRASIHEVLKTGERRTWMNQHQPTGLLWLPRFAYQRSKSEGKWSTDSVCACWVIWLKDPSEPQFIRYAPEWVIDELDKETPAHRSRMDALMGYTGSEAERHRQAVARAKAAA